MHGQIPTAKREPDEVPPALSALECSLLDEYQRAFPLSPTPYADIAETLGVSEAAVLETLKSLERRGLIARIGPVFRPHTIGASTLVAMTVPADRVEDVAAYISGLDEVNHNYLRTHEFNLWFVITAKTRELIADLLKDIERETGLSTLDLPLERNYHIDLGFPLWRRT
ncbi:MAG TPA: winged helix-turn-helix transcriptional regulator [Gammaproteobacteria bacterium]|jgi:DNA-binding Lrp family transcriptional regulator|nr:winged helix-turn-helix transcriptional regulator [Gammaproteobacteria bacterium]